MHINSQNGIKAKRNIPNVAFPRPVGGWGHPVVMLLAWLVAGDVTKWYQSHGFNTDSGWAMLVEVEEKVSKKNCC
jgi:hypothetical protein